MRKPWPTLVATTALMLSPLGLHAPLRAQTSAPLEQARVIVKYKADSPLLQRQALSVSRSTERAMSLGERVGLTLSGGAVVGERTHVVTAEGVSSVDLAKRLAAQADVEYAEPDRWRRHFSAPNDPKYAAGQVGNGPAVGQWYLRAPTSTVLSSIDAEAAWDISTGSNNVVVAVLDTGVRYDHADLGGNLLPGYDMVSDTTISKDGDGPDADASDPGDWVTAAEARSGPFKDCDQTSSWHGTQTSGLIGALTNNGVGMASVGRNVRVLPVRVLGKCGGNDSDILAGMRWAAGLHVDDSIPDNPPANRARVINLSLGGESTCPKSYKDVIAELNGLGVVVVASAGNSAGHAVATPANCPGVIAVTGLRHIGSKVGFADVGAEVGIAAPGGNCVTSGNGPCQYPILTSTNAGSTTPIANSSVYTDGINPSIGTSFSAPLVAGTVGLMLSVQSTMTAADVRAALQGSARSFPNTGGDSATTQCHAPNGVDQIECYCTATTCGAGMLDTGAAVAAASRGLQARVTLNNETPPPSQLITMSAANSFVLSSRALTSYQWTLVSGGGIVTALAVNGATATATPSAVGRFTVRLTVTDSTGAQSTVTRVVDVVVPPPPPVTPAPTRKDSGGGALGIVWLALLLAAVVALQWQRRRRVR
ncbi:MAG: S8 family serine peptidase [Rhizobacter sp.]